MFNTVVAIPVLFIVYDFFYSLWHRFLHMRQFYKVYIVILIYCSIFIILHLLITYFSWSLYYFDLLFMSTIY